MAYVELPDGVPMYYEDHGEGPAVVLIHGWTMNSTFFAQNVPALAEGNRVIAVDLRGHGNSGKTDDGHTLAQYARDIDSLLDHLALDDVCLAGWSMGTAVILSYVRQFGCGRLRSAIFVDQSPRFLGAADWDFPLQGGYTESDMAVFVQGLRHSRPTVIKPFIAACFADAPSAEAIDAAYAETTKVPTSAAAAIWYDMAYADLRPVLAEVTVPTLLIYGAQSKIFPGPLDDWLATQLPKATTVRFEHSGHVPFAEEPDRFNTVVSEFL
ncbi:alpha/beta fold hydrolase [Nocardia mexicana]|uniref:Pimeloyl-ACP methyl ester carboxylesterase n=1 Tax=Nocardia mexicana TaxID=279262 RepID=A0A370HC16_9NOCA|nr:alpha/beta hydrolase [Nocardia mexicana]RDI54496.1 pimeloyl-ACP methyl ester carboxylesterase [Nocardia mexicana]